MSPEDSLHKVIVDIKKILTALDNTGQYVNMTSKVLEIQEYIDTLPIETLMAMVNTPASSGNNESMTIMQVIDEFITTLFDHIENCTVNKVEFDFQRFAQSLARTQPKLSEAFFYV